MDVLLWTLYNNNLRALFCLQRHGKGRLRTSTKNVYEGEFQFDQMHGQGKMKYASHDIYTGHWKNGMVGVYM